MTSPDSTALALRTWGDPGDPVVVLTGPDGAAVTVPGLPARGLPGGTRDPEVEDREVRRLLDLLPDADVVSCPGAGHVLALTHTQQVADQVSRWVDPVGLRPCATASAG